MRAYTYEECVETLKKNGYTLLISKNDYQGTQNNVPCEKEGYISFISISDLLRKIRMGEKTKCNYFGLLNPYYQENINTFILKKDRKAQLLKCEVITKKNKKRILLTLQCECGNVFKKVWDDVKDNKYGTKCSKCTNTGRGFNHRKDKQEAINLFVSRGYKILEAKNNWTRNDYIEVERQDGYRGFISYNRLLQNRNIAIFDIRTNAKNYIYNANIWSKINGIGTEILDFDYDNNYSRQGIKCKCHCGAEFITSLYSFQSGKNRCDNCSATMSNYENKVKHFLDQQNIDYIYQYRINSCRDILPLPFDFFVNGKLIEIDGEGHYQICHFNQISEEDAKKSYERTQIHDAIKNDYCQKFNVPLLRVPYWEVNNGEYKEKIIQFIEA